ncbi:unnamed protein product, partial [Rotaria sp. Silwood1]
SIILGDMYLNKEQFNSAIIEYHKALNQIETQETNDLLRDAINLLIIQCTDNNNKKLYELIQIENSLMNNDDTDYNTISMKVIIYYEIAQTYLNLGEYEDARLYSNQSIKLKSNYFSSYHLSLVKDYLLIAKSYFDEKNYNESLQFYERIIEIQIVNLPPDHIDIKMSYYKIGDIYCKMEKLDEALEKYEIAKADNLHYYMPMHTNLVDLVNQLFLLINFDLNVVSSHTE